MHINYRKQRIPHHIFMHHIYIFAAGVLHHCLHVLCVNSVKHIPLYKPFLLLAAIAITDSCGNFMELLSFQNLPLEYVSILLLCTVPFSVLFSKLILKRKNTFIQLVGITFTIIGVFLTIYSYIDDNHSSAHYDYVLGTVYALACTLLLSLSNVIQEYVLLKGCTYIQLLGIMGCINTPITAVEALINGEYSSFARIFMRIDCSILITSVLFPFWHNYPYLVFLAPNVHQSGVSNNVQPQHNMHIILVATFPVLNLP